MNETGQRRRTGWLLAARTAAALLVEAVGAWTTKPGSEPVPALTRKFELAVPGLFHASRRGDVVPALGDNVIDTNDDSFTVRHATGGSADAVLFVRGAEPTAMALPCSPGGTVLATPCRSS